MIELEIQALALTREGLLLETGRLAGTCGYTLVRQRLVADPHGTLLSMVVRGSWFKQWALRTTLDGCDRLVSVKLLRASADFHPHFGATQVMHSGYVPPPAPEPEVEPEPEPVPAPSPVPVAAPAPAVPLVEGKPPEPDAEMKSWEALVTRPAAPPPRPSTVDVIAWDATPALGADTAAVDAALADLAQLWPRILPRIQALDRDVAAGARAATLELAGQRIGSWLASRAAGTGPLAATAAIERVALPVLRELVEVELGADGQLHLRHSPLCKADGHSGCGFYGGLLQGLLAPCGELMVVPVCCASFGADECIIAVTA